MKIVLLFLVLGAFAPQDLNEWHRRKLSEMEETVEAEYYLYDENVVGKCVDGPMGDDKEDMIYTCSDDGGIIATLYGMKGCEGDVEKTFTLTNNPKDEDMSYGYCVDFDEEGPGVKHAVINLRITYELPKSFVDECPSDVNKEEKDECVLVHDMEDEEGEIRLILTDRSQIAEMYSQFRKAKKSELRDMMEEEDMDEEELAAVQEKYESLFQEKMEVEVGDAANDVKKVFADKGTTAPKVISKFQDQMKWGGVAQLNEVWPFVQKMYKVAKKYYPKLKAHATRIVKELTCQVNKAVSYVCNYLFSLACWVTTKAVQYTFCNAKNHADHRQMKHSMMEKIMQDAKKDLKAAWNEIYASYKQHIKPILDVAQTLWRGGAITINVEVTVTVFTFGLSPLIFGTDRFLNAGFLAAGGWGWDGLPEGEISAGFSVTFLPMLEDIGQLAGHGAAYSIEADCGEAVIAGGSFAMEFYCGSWLAADLLGGLATPIAKARCALDSIGLVDEPKCKCSPYAQTVEQAKEDEDFGLGVEDMICHFMAPSLTVSLKLGAQIGKLLGVCDFNVGRWYAYAVALYTWSKTDRFIPTYANRICDDSFGINRYKLKKGNTRNKCMSECKRYSWCVAAEYINSKRTCYGVKTCPENKSFSGMIVYQSMDMIAKSKKVFENKCWASMKCGNTRVCKYGEVCKNGRCVSWLNAAAAEAESEVGIDLPALEGISFEEVERAGREMEVEVESSVGASSMVKEIPTSSEVFVEEEAEAGKWTYFAGGVFCTAFVGLLVSASPWMNKKSGDTIGLLNADDL